MKKLICISIVFIGLSICPNSFVIAQGIGINSSGNNPDPSAILDASSTTQGQLMPRMNTAQRDAIASPANGLMIYNTDCGNINVFNGSDWVPAFTGNGSLPTGVTASASSTSLCAGSTLTLTGGATGATIWRWTGPNGFTSTSQSPIISNITAGSGVYTLTASNACGAAAAVSTASVTVNPSPTIANAGTAINPACGISTATLAGNTPSVGTGNWSVVSGTATITTPGSPTSGVTGLAVPSTATLRWTISNSPCTPSTSDVVITTCLPPCTWNGSNSFTVTHTSGTVAPETKTVTYGQIQITISGASKCWITQNLGSSNQATDATDVTEASAGWYWQFNRKQGYKHDGTTRTPNTAWITSINESSNWLAANDPCTILLGAGWRIPTSTEWINADASGAWNNITDAYNSVLKLHAAGDLSPGGTGMLEQRGNYGDYWSSTQDTNTEGWDMLLGSGIGTIYSLSKTYGFSLRCLRD